jgi:hypothetical protein
MATIRQPLLLFSRHQRFRFSFLLCHHHRKISRIERLSFFSSKANRTVLLQAFTPHIPVVTITRCFFSTTTPSSTTGTDSQNNGRQYLCRETFPLGSFDAPVAMGVVNSIQQNVRQGSPDSVQLAIELLTRLAQEAKFQKGKHLWDEFLISSDLLHNVMLERKNKGTVTADSL